MRLVPRHRRRQRNQIAPRVAISQEEITADLEYRGEERRTGPAQAPQARGRR